MIVEIKKNFANEPDVVSFICGGLKNVLKIFQDNKCFYCECTMDNLPNSPKALSKDHFFPNSKGFNFSGNTVLACRQCNTRKGSMLPKRENIKKFIELYSDMGIGCCATMIEDDAKLIVTYID